MYVDYDKTIGRSASTQDIIMTLCTYIVTHLHVATTELKAIITFFLVLDPMQLLVALCTLSWIDVV